jgi:cleavage and polyadenylation specificity factor subunit 1
MTDEETGAEPKIVSTSFCDPYMLIIRDDASLLVLEADESGDLDAVEQGEAVTSTKWSSGSLYHDKAGIFGFQESPSDSNDATIMCVLSEKGALQVCSFFPV